MAESKVQKKKRLFPRLGQCCCCCCLPPSSSFTLCNIAMVIFLIGSPLIMLFLEFNRSKIVNISIIICFILSIIEAISVIFLIMGEKKMKLSYMKQFKIVYLIYCILILVNFFLVIYRHFDETYLENGVKEYRNMKLYSDETNEDIKKVLKRNTFAMSLFVISFFFLMTYYYLCTCSYIEDLEERMNNNEENVHNNNRKSRNNSINVRISINNDRINMYNVQNNTNNVQTRNNIHNNNINRHLLPMP